MIKVAKAVPVLMLAVLAVVWVLGLGCAPVHAFSSQGPTARTNLSGGIGCASCHGQSADPGTSVTITGPSSLLPGVTGTYTITATRAASGTGKRVGINIAASDASSLSTVLGEPTILTNMEIVHTTANTPLKTTSAGGSASYSFKYTMPANAAIGSQHTIGGVSAVSYTGGNPSTWNHAPNFTVTTAAPPPGSAGTYYVNAASGNDNNSGSQGAPFKTIKKGMAASAAGAIINVAPGTYNTAIGETFPITIKSGVQLISTSGAASTIISAQGANQRVFTCSGNAATTLIEGFTIKDGRNVVASAATVSTGGAIACTNGDQTVISRNIITNNTAQGFNSSTAVNGGTSHGGGIYIAASSPTIVNNVISNNTSLGGDGRDIPFNQSGTPTPGGPAFGGGIYVASGNPTIVNNTFYGNLAQGGAGGLNINNTTIGAAGGAASAGGIYLVSGSAINNIFSNNAAAGGSGGAISNPDGNATEGAINSTGTVNYNLFFANTAANGNPDGTVGTNAIVGQNPQFASATDYHISGVSPAKGAGTAAGAPGTDFDNKVRGNPPSLGAFDPVVPALTLSVNPTTVAEGDVATGTVTRNTSTVTPLTVNLTTSDPSAATAQPSIIIPAGAASITFAINGTTDGVADGTQIGSISVSALGFASGSASVTVTDVETPTLALSIATLPVTSPVSFSESAGATAATGTIIRNTPVNVPLTVSLISSDPTRATVPTTVTIPAGSNTVNFPITAVNNAVSDGSVTVTFTASQTGFTSGTASATVTDDDAPALTLSVAPVSFSEGAGANAATGTVSRNTSTASALTVNVSSGNTGKVTVPATVTIPAGQTSASFPISAVEDGLVDGDQIVGITASAAGLSAATVSVTVTNNDGATLSLAINPGSFSEGAGATAATATLSRNTDPTAALTVSLASSNTGRVTVPATVNIPAGAASVTFPLAAIDNAIADGTQSAILTATTPGFGSGSASATITDNDTAALIVTINPSIISEGGGAAAAAGTVTRNTPTTSSLVVNLLSDKTTRATVKASVIIPAGATSASFAIAAVNNAIADGSQTVNITASASGHTSGTATVQVVDNEVPQLNLTVSLGSFSETAGARAATATIMRSTTPGAALPVKLMSSDTTEATVPATITIPAGQASASFQIAAINDTLIDGSQGVTLTATAAGFAPGVVAVTVTDDEPNTLNLVVTPPTFAETAGASAAFGTLTRVGSNSTALAINLSSNNSGISIPTTLVIPAGAVSASFPIKALDNSVADGNRSGFITATAAGLPAAKAAVVVTDNELPALSLTVSPTTFSEAAGATIARGTVTRNSPATANLVVSLSSSKTTKAKVPATVIIPAGSTTASFVITAVDNALADGPVPVTFSASAGGFVTGLATATVTDNEGPTLALTVNPGTFSEAAGATAAKGTVTRNAISNTPLVVTLKSSNTAKATVSATVTIPANAASATFNIAAINNTVGDGPVAVTITATASGFNSGSAPLTVNDNDARLTLSVSPATFGEAAGATAAIASLSRNTPATANLVVTLKSSDTSEATVPATITIPAGATAVTFPVAAVNDTIIDGSQRATITASASTYASGTTSVTVTDNDRAVIGESVNQPVSGVALSVALARAVSGSVQLKFNGSLAAEVASNAEYYSVQVNSQVISVESASYDASTQTVTLVLLEGALRVGDQVGVSWSNLVDATGAVLGTQSVTLITR